MNTFNINDAVVYKFGHIDRKMSRVVAAGNGHILLEDVGGFGDSFINGVRVYDLAERTFFKVGTFVQKPLRYKIFGFTYHTKYEWEFKPL